ncbi:MAG: GtrA family protein [Candidatus Sulfotelmatobacter sp.]|jgi:putative flippase GtrA
MTFTLGRCGRSVPPSTLVRWCKFNLVGAIGILVQFAALLVLKSVLHFKYLAATAFAVEAAVLHNFVWHERFTWADRTMRSRRVLCTAAAGAQSYLGAVVAALKRCATQKLYRTRFRRLLRFHLGNGAVSILGNLALMKVMVGLGHMNYLLANAIAIIVCSLANFLVSEQWVFASK